MSKAIAGVIVLLLILAGIIWYVEKHKKDTKEVSGPVLSASAYNQTKNSGATSAAANPKDVIVYTLNAENQNDDVIAGYVLEVNISEVTDKSTLIDAQGASYNSATNSLIWTPLDIPAHGSIEKQFSIRVNSLPQNATNTVIKVKFNNEIDIGINNPEATVSGAETDNSKVDANKSYKAPVTGSSGSLIFLLATLTTLGYFGFKKYRLGITF